MHDSGSVSAVRAHWIAASRAAGTEASPSPKESSTLIRSPYARSLRRKEWGGGAVARERRPGCAYCSVAVRWPRGVPVSRLGHQLPNPAENLPLARNGQAPALDLGGQLAKERGEHLQLRRPARIGDHRFEDNAALLAVRGQRIVQDGKPAREVCGGAAVTMLLAGQRRRNPPTHTFNLAWVCVSASPATRRARSRARSRSESRSSEARMWNRPCTSVAAAIGGAIGSRVTCASSYVQPARAHPSPWPWRTHRRGTR